MGVPKSAGKGDNPTVRRSGAACNNRDHFDGLRKIHIVKESGISGRAGPLP
jgi:hypothetical protein